MCDVIDIEEKKEFVIDSPSKADWAVRQIKEEQARRDIYIETAKCRIAELEQEIKAKTEKCSNAISFLLFAVDNYLDTVPAKQTTTLRQLELPSGKIVRKLSKKDYSYDDKILTEYLIKNFPQYTDTITKAKWKEFKALLQISNDNVINSETGEIIECIKVVEKPSVCEVK